MPAEFKAFLPKELKDYYKTVLSTMNANFNPKKPNPS